MTSWARGAVPFVAAVVAIQAGSAERWPRWQETPAQICVERPGDGGLLNIVSARILVDDGIGLILQGETAGCLYLRPGKSHVWVESLDPYDPESKKPKTWKSNVIETTLRAGERVEFEVCGTGRQGYSTWKIQPPKSKTPCVPER